MTLATVFAALLFLALILGDWYQFTSLRRGTSRYGCVLARHRDLLPIESARLQALFGQHHALQLPHGVARWFPEQSVIVIRPSYHVFSLRFRTAWPLKGTIDIATDSQQGGLLFTLVKRIPWTSAILTTIWLTFVAMGTLVFVVMFGLDGGFQSAGGVLLALGIVALGFLVLAFGVILLSLAYRLEDQRLMHVYRELQTALTA